MTPGSDQEQHLPGFEPEPAAQTPRRAPRRAGDAPSAAADPAPDQPHLAQPLVEGDPFTVEVVRSAKRRRTVGAQLVGPVLRLAIPSWMSAAEEAHWVDEMAARFRRKLSSDRIDLPERALTLARRFDLSRPREARWADDMTARWGSCTPSTGVIRISTRVAAFPDWVVDYVIVHELAHLDVPGHDADFWQLVHRYPRSERAIGYLMAKAGEAD